MIGGSRKRGRLVTTNERNSSSLARSRALAKMHQDADDDLPDRYSSKRTRLSLCVALPGAMVTTRRARGDASPGAAIGRAGRFAKRRAEGLEELEAARRAASRPLVVIQGELVKRGASLGWVSGKARHFALLSLAGGAVLLVGRDGDGNIADEAGAMRALEARRAERVDADAVAYLKHDARSSRHDASRSDDDPSSDSDSDAHWTRADSSDDERHPPTSRGGVGERLANPPRRRRRGDPRKIVLEVSRRQFRLRAPTTRAARAWVDALNDVIAEQRARTRARELAVASPGKSPGKRPAPGTGMETGMETGTGTTRRRVDEAPPPRAGFEPASPTFAKATYVSDRPTYMSRGAAFGRR